VRVLHVLRKPLSEGTVAANVLKHGTGGLNIDASRISSTGDHMRPFQPTNNDREVYGAQTGFQPTNHAGGRWPANVILQHLDGCRQEGTKKVPTGTAVRHRGAGGGFVYGNMGNKPVGTPDMGYADADGKETVANWVCEPGCPVARLDEQSGVRPSTLTGRASPYTSHKHPSTSTTDNRVAMNGGLTQPGGQVYADTGGASRFYKQVGGSK